MTKKIGKKSLKAYKNLVNKLKNRAEEEIDRAGKQIKSAKVCLKWEAIEKILKWRENKKDPKIEWGLKRFLGITEKEIKQEAKRRNNHQGDKYDESLEE